MIKYEKIIFVCTANTSRSVMCEAIYKTLETNSEIKVLSRGLVVLFPEPVNPKTAIVMENHERPIGEHSAVALTLEDIDENTLLLTMNEKQKDKLKEDFDVEENLYTLREFVGESGDVYDPYGKNLVEYEECYVELARLVKKTVYKLNEEDL